MRLPAILSILFACFGSLSAQLEVANIDSLVTEAIQSDYFSGTVLIADQGQVCYQNSVGYAERSTTRMVNDSTIFSIASITKMITSILVLQLEAEGKLTLEDTVHDWLPELEVPRAKKITIHHLLLHISGLPNEADRIYLSPSKPREFVQKTLTENPGKGKFGQFNYANIDYVLLGLIIEKATKTDWQTVVDQRIITPLGLRHTGFLAKDNYPANFAYSYQILADGKALRDPDFYPENFYAAACMYANASDLLKIDQALHGDQLLTTESKEKMYTSYPEYNYTGYGVWSYRYPFAPKMPLVMERRGSIMGSNVVILRLLEMNRTIIILSNNNRFDPDTFGDTASLRESLLIEVAK